MFCAVGAGLGSLDFAAAGLEGSAVDGAVDLGVVVAAPDEQPANASTAIPATIAIRFLMLDLLSPDPDWGRTTARLADAA